MRTVQWLFLVSVALFISGIGFVIAAARTTREAPAAVEAPQPEAVASIKQVMDGITMPAATAVYSAVGTIVNAEGVKETAPQNDEEWAALASQAAALVESGNLLLMGNRLVDNSDWVTMTRAMIEKGQSAIKAAEAQDKEGILDAGSAINDTCDTCHAKYQRQ
ncbi:MAG TPA: hypothetical protein VIK60_18000 [Vicinamibacterales bacterium]